MSDTPERSTGPFTHNVSTHPAGIIECDENTIRDADGCTLIRQWYGSLLGHGEYVDFVALAPGDWHLFAAAPEMLEALKAFTRIDTAIKMDVMLYGNSRFPEEWLECRKTALAAIAKAEGRQP